jgi:hypothetical protein
MDFRQALSMLLNGGTITCPELGRPGTFLAMQEPIGGISKPFIVQETGAGERMPWCPTQDSILGKAWTQVHGGAVHQAAQTQHEHEPART